MENSDRATPPSSLLLWSAYDHFSAFNPSAQQLAGDHNAVVRFALRDTVNPGTPGE